MDSVSKKDAFGVHELYRPTDGTADVDIIAVHGLNGDAIKTWCSKSKICWLSHPDFLPKYLPRARVLSWGYNANISSLKGKSTSQDRILHHAQSLISQLNADRELEDAMERPIIFLCHSLGGIVVKRALAYSAGRKGAKISFLRSIYICTYGILFFGTPHHGSSKANILSSIQKLAAITIPSSVLNTESNLLNALREGSETLQDINDQFCPLISRFQIFFFWEQERMELKYLKKADYIVTEASAAPMLDNTERCGIAADHSEMCKFESAGCQAFRDVIAALKRYSRSAPNVISTRVGREKEATLQIRREEAAELMGIRIPELALASQQHNILSPIPRRSTETVTEPVSGSTSRAMLDVPDVRLSFLQSAWEQRIL